MSLFPRRVPVAEFMVEYKKRDAVGETDDDGIDLLEHGNSDDEEPIDPENEEDRRMIDQSYKDTEEDEAQHKALDAARRAEEDAQVAALAARFEARAASYVARDRELPEVDPMLLEMYTAARKAARKHAAHVKARAEAAASKARAEEEARLVAKQAAMESLFELYAESDTMASASGALTGKRKQVEREEREEVGVEERRKLNEQEAAPRAASGAGRYRIKKKAKAA